MACTGDGSCIQKCCHSFIEDEDRCSNGNLGADHYLGTGYCKSECKYNCDIIPCHNYPECGRERPQWVLNQNKGLCGKCEANLGKLTFLRVEEECPICYEVEELVILPCGKHKIGRYCWVTISGSIPSDKPPCCPMCREPIW